MTRGLRGATASNDPWRSRIVGHGEEAPDQLLANPANWRIHPKAQQQALTGALDEVGWVAQVLVNRRTGHVVDGHLRVELAISRGEPLVPVLYVDLSEEEERFVLVTLDPLAAMAGADTAQIAALLASLAVDDEGLRAMLDDLARDHGLDALRGGLVDPDDVPAVPDEPYVGIGELWMLGDHRLLVGDATNPAHVTHLLDGAEPTLLSTDPPYGVSLDPTWRDGVHNALGPAEKPYMQLDDDQEGSAATAPPRARHVRTKGHRNTTLSGDTRIDWSEAFVAPDSIILFGSKLRGVFVVDTVAGEVGVIDARLAGRRALVAGDLTQAIGRARHDDHIVSPLSCAAVYDIHPIAQPERQSLVLL